MRLSNFSHNKRKLSLQSPSLSWCCAASLIISFASDVLSFLNLAVLLVNTHTHSRQRLNEMASDMMSTAECENLDGRIDPLSDQLVRACARIACVPVQLACATALFSFSRESTRTDCVS